ncbi:hypothetical protein Tco_1227736 [Tanacetum coccineum]
MNGVLISEFSPRIASPKDKFDITALYVLVMSHVVTLHHPIAAKLTEISGTIAFAIWETPADCTSLGISKALFLGGA